MIYVDIGACRGEEVQLAYHLGYEVHAFEPHPQNIEHIKYILGDKITLNEGAAWKEDGTKKLYFHRGGNMDGASLIAAKGNVDDEGVAVKTFNIREYVDKLGTVDIIKIDAEGAEFVILESILGADVKKICYEDHIRKIEDSRWREHREYVLQLYRKKGIELYEWR